VPRAREYPAVSPQSARQYPFSFPATARTAENSPHQSWRLRITALAIALVVSSVLAVGGAAGAEMGSPVTHNGPALALDPPAEFIVEASHRFGVPASWIRAVMHVESGGDVHALSPTGAMGLMQIMPETWTGLRSRYHLGTDPYDPRDNIFAGAAYLRELHDRYGAPGFLAAYNAGPLRYEDHLTTGRPLPVETRAYMAVLAPMIGSEPEDGVIVVATATRSWIDAPIFAPRGESKSSEARPPSDPPSGRPSVSGRVQDFTALAPQSEGLFVRIASRNSKP